MIIEIDQSGKIEDTSKSTIVAFSNDIAGSILISAKEKREIQETFRRAGKSRVFVYKLFAILIFVLIKKHLKKIEAIIADEEYPGWGFQIKDYLLTQIRKVRTDFDKNNINFKQIGKKSRAHFLAYAVYKNKRKPDLEVGQKDILKFII
jgi:hypothetical protein